jgi:hypothetical protein
MEQIIFVQFGFVIFGIANLIFGLLLLFSTRFFNFWQNRYWQEKDGAHKTKEGVYYNKYMRGLLSVFVGLVCIYFALFTP